MNLQQSMHKQLQQQPANNQPPTSGPIATASPAAAAVDNGSAISEVNQEMLSNLQGGDAIDKSNDWTVQTIDNRRFLTTGISLYELLDDEKFAPLCVVSQSDPTLLLYPYRDVHSNAVVEPGKEYLGGSMPYITEIMAKIAAGRPWSKPNQSSGKTLKQHRAVQRAQFDLKAGADESKVLEMLNRDFAQIDDEESSDEDEGDAEMTWADVRREAETKQRHKRRTGSGRGDNRDLASGTESSSSESSRDVSSAESSEGSTFDGPKKSKNRRAPANNHGGFDNAHSDRQSGGFAGSPFTNPQNDDFGENDDDGYGYGGGYDDDERAAAPPQRQPNMMPALSNLPRYQAGQFSGYGKIQSAPKGAPVININCSGRDYQEAYDSDEEFEDEEYDSEWEEQQQTMQYNNRSLMADADMIDQYDLNPVLAQKPRLRPTKAGTKRRENAILGWHNDDSQEPQQQPHEQQQYGQQHGQQSATETEQHAQYTEDAQQQQPENQAQYKVYKEDEESWSEPFCEPWCEEGYDDAGGYYDGYGGYYDAEGGYIDADGGYYDKEGGYVTADGKYFTPAEVEAWETGEPLRRPADEPVADKHFFNGQWLPLLQPENVQVNQRGEIEKRLDKNLVGLTAKEARKVQKDRQLNAEEITKSRSTINQATQRNKKKTLADDLKGFNLPPDIMANLEKQGALNATVPDFPSDISEIAHLGKAFVPSKTKKDATNPTQNIEQARLQTLPANQSNVDKSTGPQQQQQQQQPQQQEKQQQQKQQQRTIGGGAAEFSVNVSLSELKLLHTTIAEQMKAMASQMRASAQQMDASANIAQLVNNMFVGELKK